MEDSIVWSNILPPLLLVQLDKGLSVRCGAVEFDHANGGVIFAGEDVPDGWRVRYPSITENGLSFAV